MRGSEVVQDSLFKDDLTVLRREFPEIDRVVADFTEVLLLDYDLPEIPVDPATPRVYTHLVDYPPRAASGLQQFIVIYHATDPDPSPRQPYRTFTLLAIADRKA